MKRRIEKLHYENEEIESERIVYAYQQIVVS